MTSLRFLSPVYCDESTSAAVRPQARLLSTHIPILPHLFVLTVCPSIIVRYFCPVISFRDPFYGVRDSESEVVSNQTSQSGMGYLVWNLVYISIWLTIVRGLSPALSV